ncbi:MAG: division/cell wall cluster transcriptional repressor MraZ [Chloroflexi bacterium]|nr:division/cell wall cluster transcriptional repressor MraZ [Chloroflexota bacterium]
MGEYLHSIDEKGRLTVPARYRQLLAEGGYITHGFDQNLMVLRSGSFEQMSSKVNQMSLTKQSARELRRLLFSQAQFIEPDKSGRILIPQFLRDEMGLNGEAQVVGVGAYFEIWTQPVWKKQMAAMRDAQANAQYFEDLDLFADEDA